jgi:ATP-dependent Lon protease
MEPQDSSTQLQKIEQKIAGVHLPEDLAEKAEMTLQRLRLIEKEASFITEYDSAFRYIDWITGLPWDKKSEDMLDLKHAKEVLDKSHFGLEEIKNSILEYLSILIMRKVHPDVVGEAISRAPIISLVGLVGTGKTTIAHSIATAMGRQFVRIPFGGLGGPAMLRGQSRVYPDSEPGGIIKALRRAGTNNPVILLDEIDRVSEHVRSDIMGVLVELLDPEQNKAFIDHYIDYPVDLSNVLFIATSNNTKDISTAVLDRLEVLQMPSYTDHEKAAIAKSYMFPQILRESGLTEHDIIVDDNLWDVIIRPLGYDPGIRTLSRTIQGMVRKIARGKIEGKIPNGQPFALRADNIKQYLPAW